jgi:hypothetical protein
MSPVGWVEPLRNPSSCPREFDGFRFALAILRAEPHPLRLPLDRPVPPLARPRHRAQIPRRDAAQGRAQSGALLLHVRPEILLDEDPPGRARLAATLNDPQQSMAEMSKKFIDMGAEVYVDQTAVVKEANKVL